MTLHNDRVVRASSGSSVLRWARGLAGAFAAVLLDRAVAPAEADAQPTSNDATRQHQRGDADNQKHAQGKHDQADASHQGHGHHHHHGHGGNGGQGGNASDSGNGGGKGGAGHNLFDSPLATKAKRMARQEGVQHHAGGSGNAGAGGHGAANGANGAAQTGHVSVTVPASAGTVIPMPGGAPPIVIGPDGFLVSQPTSNPAGGATSTPLS
jgi:hypothetical protein